MTRTFFSPDRTRYVLFTENVLRHMYSFAQRKCKQTEAGGEIFSPRPYSCSLLVDAIAGPHPEDHRSRYSYNPNTSATSRARNEQYACDRHAVGLWHTHPEAQPHPSGLDRATTQDYLRSFAGTRSRYLSVIIGNRGDTPAITVWATEELGDWQRWDEFCGQTEVITKLRR